MDVTGAVPEEVDREPYDKLDLYSDSVRSRVDASTESLVLLYEALIAVSSGGWVEEEHDRYETHCEAFWDDRRADEPLFDNAVSWAHVSVVEKGA